MATTELVRCPGCGKQQSKRGGDAIYWCPNCRCQHDDSPDEGGTYSDRNPAARLERAERQLERRKQHRRRF
jgi:ribosomal protein L37AE/L43A